MRNINANLVICGSGNFFQQARELADSFGVNDKVRFEGPVPPDKLREFTSRAYLGITLFEKESRSNYFSLANRFFDYMHAGVPQLCVNYPLYREITDVFPFAILIDEPTEENITAAINSILSDPVRWEALHQQCLNASKQLNWQEEEKKLINYYNRIFGKTSSYHHT
jgi:glycosyltransferase involved in cell wall biosynthesis